MVTAPRISTSSIARWAAVHPWWTLTLWLGGLLISGALILALLPSATTTDQGFTFDPESKIARDLLEERMTGPAEVQEIAVIRSERFTVDDAEYERHVTQLTQAWQDLGPAVIRFESGRPSIATYYLTGNEAFVSPDRHTTIVPITMAGGLDEANANIDSVLEVANTVGSTDSFSTHVAGPASIGHDFQTVAEEDLRRGETIGVLVALVILLLVFRAVGAAWIPIVLAFVSIGVATAAVAVIGQAYQLSFFVTNMITMIGLAVGIDYTLFIIARYREERSEGLDKISAIARAGATAGKAVTFSGITVVLALIGMIIVPTTVFFSLGLGAVLVVIVAVLASTTVLPAILSLMGDRVDAWQIRLPARRSRAGANGVAGFWNRVTYVVMRHPWPALILTGGLLIAASMPYFNINTGAAGVSTLPENFQSKRAFDVLKSEFPNALGGLASADIVIDGKADSPEVRVAVGRLKEMLAEDPVFGDAEYQVNEPGDLGLLKAVIKADGASKLATEKVRFLRDELIPAAGFPTQVYVGGQTALNVDFFEVADTWTPIVIAFVLSLSFILLTIVFRSVVVPIKAIVLNLLSVGTAYGLLVLVLQEGFLIDLFGFRQVETVEAWLPVFLFSILFGLSMDYEVFLLSRIRERYDQTGINSESVAFGVRSTAGIITGAALIMVVVFAGFAMGELTMFQQLGFGLGVAILVDATVIRAILVPATMRLLGDRNWYLPKALAWLPDVRIEAGDRRAAPSGAQDGKGS